MTRERYTAEQVAKAIREARGMQTVAAHALGCSRSTVARYIKRHATVQEAYEEAREELLDRAETQLMDAVDRGEWQAVRFALDSLGGSRGYGDAPEEEENFSEEWERGVKEFEARIEKAYGQTP